MPPTLVVILVLLIPLAIMGPFLLFAYLSDRADRIQWDRENDRFFREMSALNERINRK